MMLTQKSVALTDKLHQKVKSTAAQHGVEIEALGNIVLYLALTDGRTVQQAADLIKHLSLHGVSTLEKSGW